MAEELLYRRTELFGILPLGRWKLVTEDMPIPSRGRGYFGGERRVQIARTPEHPHSLQISDEQGRMVRRSIMGSTLYQTGLTADGNFPGIRIRLQTFPHSS